MRDLLESIESLPPADLAAAIESLPPAHQINLRYCWEFFARPEQLPPDGPWSVWLVLAGRGWGKTRTGAQWVCRRALQGRRERIALVGRSAADVRDVMIEGSSGILSCSHPQNMPLYEPSKRRLVWPTGAIATAYTSEEPRLLRGPQHSAAWCDELCAWGSGYEAWDQLRYGMRMGHNPQTIVTTTPRPVRVIRDLMSRPTTIVTRGSTFENRGNLAEAYLSEMADQYAGTALGRQELYAEVIDHMPGALWTRAMLEQTRHVGGLPGMVRVVVAIDPAVSAHEGSAETGIVAAGQGDDGLYYVLRDVSGVMSPGDWATRAVMLFHELRADRVVAETNQGGDLVEATLRHVDDEVPYIGVHAKRGKFARAEPVAALYEQGKVRHCGGLADLEDQLCGWAPGIGAARSPDRLDAMVYALTALSRTPDMPIEIGLIDHAPCHRWA